MQGGSRASSPLLHRPNTVTSNQAGPREPRQADVMDPTPFQMYSAGPRLDHRGPPGPEGGHPSPRREPPLLMGRPQQPRASHPHDRMPHFEMGHPTHSPTSMMPHLPSSPSWQRQQQQQEGAGPQSGYPPGVGHSPADPRTRRESRQEPSHGGAGEPAAHPSSRPGAQRSPSPTRGSPHRPHPTMQDSGGLEGRPSPQSGHLPGLPLGVHMSGGPHARVGVRPHPQPPSSRFADVGWAPEPGTQERTHGGDMPHRLYSFNHWADGRPHGESHSPGMPIRGRSSGTPDVGFQFAPGPSASGGPSPSLPRSSAHPQ